MSSSSESGSVRKVLSELSHQPDNPQHSAAPFCLMRHVKAPEKSLYFPNTTLPPALILLLRLMSSVGTGVAVGRGVAVGPGVAISEVRDCSSPTPSEDDCCGEAGRAADGVVGRAFFSASSSFLKAATSELSTSTSLTTSTGTSISTTLSTTSGSPEQAIVARVSSKSAANTKTTDVEPALALMCWGGG